MTIQQATGRAITKVETGDYDMMDEVGLVIIFRVSATCLTFACTRNITAATEGNPEEEISRRETGAGRTLENVHVQLLIRPPPTTAPLSPPTTPRPRVIRMFDEIQRVPFYRTTLSYCVIFIERVIRDNPNRNRTRGGECASVSV